jgi:ketosteroid isomerase-like protein
LDKDKQKRSSGSSQPESGSELEELFRKLSPEMRRPKPGADAIAAALEAAQRLAAETDAENAATDTFQDLGSESSSGLCRVCGYRNRGGNKFCGMCGAAVEASEPEQSFPPQERRPRPIALHPNPFLDPEPEPAPPAQFEPMLPRSAAPRPTGQETHHYHHHYHHHYFPGSQEGMMPRAGAEPAREAERLRPSAGALRGDMSRAEAAVRRITQEWVLACNTKHLDDLLELYVADGLVLRSNCLPIRGAAAVREFFFGALDSGLGEVEIEPLRLDVAGELAYEAGRFKALVPSASGKRREERGKYVWVCSRQSGGDWKIVVDCWSSDLTLTTLESDVPAGTAVKSAQPRKNS